MVVVSLLPSSARMDLANPQLRVVLRRMAVLQVHLFVVLAELALHMHVCNLSVSALQRRILEFNVRMVSMLLLHPHVRL